MPLTRIDAPGPDADELNGHHAPAAVETRATAKRARAAAGGDARRRARTVAKQQQAAERIAAATTQLARNVASATDAARALETAMQEIASGAEEASSASQESLAVVDRMSERIGLQRTESRRVEGAVGALQNLLADTTTGIEQLIQNVGDASQRQAASVQMISELEKQAEQIGDIVKTVARIADQTNLLALNAAIEAARARQHGKGFAVVADEVRTLAETSERSASQIRELVEEIRTAVNDISQGVNTSAESARQEVEKGRSITTTLVTLRDDMGVVLTGATEIAAAAEQAERGADTAKLRSQEIAAAAEEQSAACEESLQALGQETAALRQGETASEELAELADELRTSADIGKSAEGVASTAEELSSAVEEIDTAARQILTGIQQIQEGSRSAASRGQEAASAIGQIEQGAQLSADRATVALEKSETLQGLLAENKVAVDEMLVNIGTSAEASREAVRQIAALDVTSRRIDKIVDAIANVAIQTNMLAVNGSVESARAGEFGKGFAVVSTDIRNLARESGENAEQIKDLVKDVQDRIVAVRADLEETSRMAIAEVERAKETTSRLEEMERDMSSVRDGAKGILEASEHIQRASAEAKTGLDQIASASAQAEQLTKQAQGTAQEQRNGTEELASAVEEIAALADELQNG